MEDQPPQPLNIVPVPVQPSPISIDTGHHFAIAAKENSKDDLITWAKKVAQKLKFTIIVRRSDNGGIRLDTELEGHLVAGRLKPEETLLVNEMTKNLVPPRNILSTLKERDPENTMSSKQCYNARYRYKAKMRASMSEMQHMFKHLSDNKYFFKYRSHVDEGGEYLQDIFFAHPRSLCMFNSFPTVLVMDSTYKTNKYNMPLFEIVVFTSTERTYNVGFAWLTNEKEDNFIWALQQLRSLVRNEGSLPKVILTDRYTALMNVVGQVFPTSAAMVCRVHVQKNVGSKIKELLKFRELCKKWPRLLRYIEETVLDTDKEKVVCAWVDKHMHMGNYTTNRVESAHGVLKKSLEDSSGDLVKGWEPIHHMLGLQFTEVQTQFGQSMSVEEHRYRDVRLYSLLPFKVSRATLDYIYQEAKRVDNVVKLKEGCPIPKTNAQWKRHAAEHTKDWETYFMDRQKEFEVMSIEIGDVSTVGVGSEDNPMTID
ncbi:hypothetical protein TSUD_87450 [Trifolium subterraneum]|uniref:MULE transposase domain-containing protein n=1 Tax=Trifolium subterraneum TaxID=3900 RepID=A0A2Z6P7E3_TRISU|nr:hypothetical protein TSUD_87450 [Trifolium subterraneum]